MNVLHTLNSLHPDTGGPARSVPGLAQAAAKAGATVHLWAGVIPDDYEAPDKIEIHHGKLPDIKFDLIHDHGVWLANNHHVATWASARRIPRIVSPRGMLEPWALNHHKWKKRIAWWLYQKRDLKSASAFHATADAEAAQIQSLGLHKPSFVIPNGIQIDDFRGDFTKKKTVLFLSRIHPKKGLPMWLEAWQKVAPKDWKMQIAGPDEGGHTNELKALVAKAGLASQWTFEGPVEGSEKCRILGSASIFVLPTYSENFGIVVAEALASGTPVITTTGTPWQGLLEHHCGWWVAPNVDSLAKAFAEAIASEERVEMGRRGSQWIQTDFSWDEIGQKIVTAYQQTLDGY